MALTEKNQLLIAFKKLYGKSHTNAKFGIFNESAASSVQLGISKIFGQNIPSSPSSSLYSITNGTVEKIKFNLASIALSSYSNTLGSLAFSGVPFIPLPTLMNSDAASYFPIEIMAKNTDGSEVFIMKTNDIKPGAIDESVFAIPVGYELAEIPTLPNAK